MTMTQFKDGARRVAVVVLTGLATFCNACSVTFSGWADYLDNK